LERGSQKGLLFGGRRSIPRHGERSGVGKKSVLAGKVPEHTLVQALATQWREVSRMEGLREGSI